MNQFIPVENESGRVSRGYAECKPFDKVNTHWMSPERRVELQEEFEEMRKREKDGEIRSKIKNIVYDIYELNVNKDDVDSAVDEIMKIVKKGYSV